MYVNNLLKILSNQLTTVIVTLHVKLQQPAVRIVLDVSIM